MPLNRLGDYLSQAVWNQNVEALEAAARLNVGRGILSGCAVTVDSGLAVEVSEGVLHGAGCAVSITAPLTYTLPASGTFSLWFNASTSALSHSADATDPGEPMICLGRIVTGASTITAISTQGRIGLLRQDGEDLILGDNKIVMNATTGAVAVAGGLESNGLTNLTARVSNPVNVQTLTSNLTLDDTSPNIQVLTPSGGTRSVILPDITDWGTEYTFHNVSATNSLLVRNHADTTTLATVAPASSEMIVPSVSPSGGTTPDFVRAVASSTTTPTEGEGTPTP